MSVRGEFINPHLGCGNTVTGSVYNRATSYNGKVSHGESPVDTETVSPPHAKLARFRYRYPSSHAAIYKFADKTLIFVAE